MKALHAIGHLNFTLPVRSCPLPRILNKPTCIQSRHPGRRTHFSDRRIPFSPTGKVPWEGIHISRCNTHFKKPDLPWGFSIYRCTYKDDKAWERVLQLLQDSVEQFLEEGAPELIPHHQLVINDDVTKFDGATSHEIRDHFNAWVEEQLPLVANYPERLHMFGGSCPEYSLGARFNYALFVDDICLESLDHMTSPVVKILYKQWGNLTPEERTRSRSGETLKKRYQIPANAVAAPRNQPHLHQSKQSRLLDTMSTLFARQMEMALAKMPMHIHPRYLHHFQNSTH